MTLVSFACISLTALSLIYYIMSAVTYSIMADETLRAIISKHVHVRVTKWQQMCRFWSFAHTPCYLNQRDGVQGLHDEEINDKIRVTMYIYLYGPQW